MNRWLTSSVRAGGSKIEPSVRKMRRSAREAEKQAPRQRRRACQRSDPTGSRKPPRFPADVHFREMVSRFARGLTSWLGMAFLSISIPRNDSTAAWRCLVATMEVWSVLLSERHNNNEMRARLNQPRAMAPWEAGRWVAASSNPLRPWFVLSSPCAKQRGGRAFWLGDRLNHRMPLGLV